MDIQTLLELTPDFSPHERDLIQRAYSRAEKAHEGQKRKSGEPYFTHCVAVAHTLAEMNLDAETLAAALLHDVLEDTDVTIEELRDEFNDTIAAMVDGVTKLKKLPFSSQPVKGARNPDAGLESIRKMLLAMDDDVRVVLVKLADRLHNMRTLGYLSREKQIEKAQETLDIYAPLANRLGIWQIKWELEDLSFRYLNPEAYRTILNNLNERQATREAYVNEVIATLREALNKNNINARITGRPKHIYSIYKKMQRKQIPLDQVYDVRALRVIVDNKIECYQVLGIVHDLWRPIPNEFDDYIASPKDNFYQSLHTAVVDGKGKTIEVQIRTEEMHRHAEYGIAAHWRYKENRKSKDEAFEKRIAYFRQLLHAGSDDEVDSDAEEFVDTLKADVFQDRVYVFTPKGDIIDLPVGATPIDFAYHIHTEIGHRCRGAKVNGKIVNLNYQLKMGDQVSILTSKRGGPSLDWLNPHLGYVKTGRARSKIRVWFRKLNREQHISDGRHVLEREVRRLGVNDSMTFDSIAALFNYDKVDDFLAAVGGGEINTAQIANRILQQEQENERASKKQHETGRRRQKSAPMVVDDATHGIDIMGVSGLLTTVARCCNPVPGDDIIGYITRGRGVMVHRLDCKNIANSTETERLVDVAWREVVNDTQHYSADVEVIAYDREGLMHDISGLISDENVNMSSINVSTQQEIATFHVTLEISNISQLTRILARIGSMTEVLEVRRRVIA
ncbi:MAG: bifunctional (p)ppGpp synthetase/guanosine-3',5'-bis(diphosphate) 3'-pyrophosphohydrolase [Chloroflexi bacterium]|nr:MAG: bifunctional (p)ppGpp synthetase/guanosine-3',5'-bis(diphosphate) 3'-pyrophosphohydrolase [Chloroflexota bacterium]